MIRTNIRHGLRQYISRNFLFYALGILAYVIGICAGILSVCFTAPAERHELRQYLANVLNISDTDAIYGVDPNAESNTSQNGTTATDGTSPQSNSTATDSNIAQNSVTDNTAPQNDDVGLGLDIINFTQLFKLSAFSNIKFLGIQWALGSMVIGSPFVLFVLGSRGFVFGFSIAAFIASAGIKGFLFCVLGLFPQNLVFIPCYIVASVICVRFSVGIYYRKDSLKKQIVFYCLKIVFIFLILLIGSFIEAYISPVFIRLLLKYFT